MTSEFFVHKGGASRTVTRSEELLRIAALPRYDIAELTDRAQSIILDCIKPTGDMKIRPLQMQALTAAFHTGGLAGLLSVGSGKTLVASLIPSLFPDSRALILAKAGLVSQGERMMREYSDSFSISSSVRWMSYDFLSRAGGTDILTHIKPDIIIADEAQCLSNPKAARTKRFLRYMEEHPQTMFFFLSGTITRHSLKDFAHLMALALEEGSPVPRTWAPITEWAECLDSDQGCRYPGALSMLSPTQELLPDIDAGRRVVQARIKDTLGVVASEAGSVEATITFKPLKIKPSEKIQKALVSLHETWTRPDGEELVSAIDVWRLRGQFLLGGYYKWVEKPPVKWIDARKNWHRGLREFLSKHSAPHIDSPLLVTNAIRAQNATLLKGHMTPLTGLYQAWKIQEATFPVPNVKWEWIDFSHLERLRDEINSLGPSIVWTNYRAPSTALAHILQAPYYGAGEGDAINAEDGSRTIVASIRAHKEGRNLQAFNRNVMVGSLNAGADWEQLIGRTHRAGQEADEITFHLPLYMKEELEKGVEDAKYIEALTGNQQKLSFADREDELL